jgi:Sigma-70 region 2
VAKLWINGFLVQSDKIYMDELNEQLNEWIKEACQAPRYSIARKKAITRIIATMQRTGKIWRGYGSDHSFYEDALHDTWLWFVKHLEEYDPDKGTVLAWFNTHLKYRLMDARIRRAKELRMQTYPYLLNGEWVDPADKIPGKPDLPPMLDDFLDWLELNQKKFRRIHLRNRPEVNCYVLILHRVRLLETYLEWKLLSQQFEVPVPTLSSFYQTHCLPCLRGFGQ